MWTKAGFAAVATALCTSASALDVAWGDWWDSEGLLGAYLEGPAGTLRLLAHKPR